jgi:hypothetical protein
MACPGQQDVYQRGQAALPGRVRPGSARLHRQNDEHEQRDQYVDGDPGHSDDPRPAGEPAAEVELAQVHQGDCQRQDGEDEYCGHGDPCVGPQCLPSSQCLNGDTGPVGRAE